MEVILDQKTETIIGSVGYSSPVTTLTDRRSAASPLTVRFAEKGDYVDPGEPEIFFVVKQAGKYDENPALVLTGAFVKVADGDSYKWTGSANYITGVLDGLFQVDEDADNDVAELSLMCEFIWIAAGVTRRTGRVALTLKNNIYRGDEEVPAVEPAPGTYVTVASQENIRFLPNVVGLVGGGATKLDGTATLGVPRPRLLGIFVAGEPRLWILRDWVDEVEDEGAGIIIPDDFDEDDNACVITPYL